MSVADCYVPRHPLGAIPRVTRTSVLRARVRVPVAEPRERERVTMRIEDLACVYA